MSELKLCPFCGGEAKFVHIFENPEKCMVSCRECDGGIDAVFANEEAAAEAWNRRAQPANKPLTLDELRGMDGEPVWCTDGEGHSCYCIVNSKSADCTDNEAGAWCFEFYGMTGDGKNGLHPMGWIVYRRKPEGSETDAKV